MKVYDAESEEHAARIAKSTIGKALRTTPLNVVDVEEFEGGKEKREKEKKKPTAEEE